MEPVLCSLFLEGYTLHKHKQLGKGHLLFTLEALHDPVCGGCGNRCSSIHDQTVGRVRDCDLLDQRLSLDECSSGSLRALWNKDGSPQLATETQQADMRGIIASAKYPLNTSVLERFSKVIA